jgi:hypothetical protein
MPRSSEVKKLEANLPADSQNSQIPSGYMHIKEALLPKHTKGKRQTSTKRAQNSSPLTRLYTKPDERP